MRLLTNPNPDHFFEQAETLLAISKRAPRQVEIRRAISAAYYGAFHFILQKAADEFVGRTPAARSSSVYTLVYRSIDHRTLRELCASVKQSSLPEKLKAFVPNGNFADPIKELAAALVDLQEKRHGADYDPSLKFNSSDAISAIETARSAISSFNSADVEHQRAFVALLTFRRR